MVKQKRLFIEGMTFDTEEECGKFIMEQAGVAKLIDEDAGGNTGRTSTEASTGEDEAMEDNEKRWRD